MQSYFEVVQVKSALNRLRAVFGVCVLIAFGASHGARADQSAPDKLRVYADGMELPQTLANSPLLTTQGVTKDNYDVLARRENGKIVLQRKDGTTLREITDNADASGKVTDALEAQWRWGFLRGLHNDDPNSPLKVDFRLVPLNVRFDVNGTPQEVLGASKNVEMDGERPVLRDGDTVLIQLRNRSAEDVYVSVLDLGPDGSISQLFPDPSAVPQYNIIPADGNWHPVFRPFEVGPPFGQEVFKALATRSYVDFRPAQSARTVIAARGAPTLTLSKLLLTSSSSKRAPQPGELASDAWTSVEVVADVKAKK